MKVDISKIKQSKGAIWIALDLLMVFVVIVNLIWMIFDWFFIQDLVSDYFKNSTPQFYNWYQNSIHFNYIAIDGIFVSVYVLDLLVRWIRSVYIKEYSKWFVFPFAKWYDVLGCIPLGSFRFLRLFRIVSMMIRLHKMRVINMKETWWYQLFARNYEILSEEVTDRVVVNMIESAEQEIEDGGPLVDKIVNEVIIPKHDVIASLITTKFQQVSRSFYQRHRNDIEDYITNIVSKSIDQNEEVKKISKVPVIGRQINKTLQSAVSEVTQNVINQIIHDLGDSSNQQHVKELVDEFLMDGLSDEGLDESVLHGLSKSVIFESLEIIKNEVQKNEWEEEES